MDFKLRPRSSFKTETGYIQYVVDLICHEVKSALVVEHAEEIKKAKSLSVINDEAITIIARDLAECGFTFSKTTITKGGKNEAVIDVPCGKSQVLHIGNNLFPPSIDIIVNNTKIATTHRKEKEANAELEKESELEKE